MIRTAWSLLVLSIISGTSATSLNSGSTLSQIGFKLKYACLYCDSSSSLLNFLPDSYFCGDDFLDGDYFSSYYFFLLPQQHRTATTPIVTSASADPAAIQIQIGVSSSSVTVFSDKVPISARISGYSTRSASFVWTS